GLSDGVTGRAGEMRDPFSLDDGERVPRMIRRESTLGDGTVLGELLFAETATASVRDICRQRVTTLEELRHLVLVAARTRRGRRLSDDERAFVGHGARMILLHLVAVPAAYARRGHRAVPVLLDDPGRRLPVAGHARVAARGEGVDRPGSRR